MKHRQLEQSFHFQAERRLAEASIRLPRNVIAVHPHKGYILTGEITVQKCREDRERERERERESTVDLDRCVTLSGMGDYIEVFKELREGAAPKWRCAGD